MFNDDDDDDNDDEDALEILFLSLCCFKFLFILYYIHLVSSLPPSLCYFVYGHNLFPYYFNIFYPFLVDDPHGDHTQHQQQQQLPHKKDRNHRIIMVIFVCF